MDVKQGRPFFFERAKEFIQELQRRRAEILNDRMNRDDRRQTARETLLCLHHQSLHIAPLRGGLHFNRSKSRKHSVFVQIGASSLAWPVLHAVLDAVLHGAHSSLEPCRSRIRVCAVARRTGAEWARGKQVPENSRRTVDRSPLLVQWQESTCGPQLRTPVLIPDPRHPPVNVRSLRPPQFFHQLRPLSANGQFSRNRPFAKVSQPMQGGGKQALSNALPIRLQQLRTMPLPRQAFG